jgi:hypothetical protein
MAGARLGFFFSLSLSMGRRAPFRLKNFGIFHNDKKVFYARGQRSLSARRRAACLILIIFVFSFVREIKSFLHKFNETITQQ